MRQAIQHIIDDIPIGCIFDSHFIITRLIKFHSDEYLTFASSIDSSTNKTLAVHGKIAQEIANFEKSVIQRLDQNSFSENIHGNASICTCWQKIQN